MKNTVVIEKSKKKAKQQGKKLLLGHSEEELGGLNSTRELGKALAD